MSKTETALKLALEALEYIENNYMSLPAPASKAITAIREALAQSEQEPYCYHDGRNIVGKEYADHSDVFPLYDAPQPRQWRGLTYEEAVQIIESFYGDEVDMLRSLEAKLKEKNT